MAHHQMYTVVGINMRNLIDSLKGIFQKNTENTDLDCDPTSEVQEPSVQTESKRIVERQEVIQLKMPKSVDSLFYAASALVIDSNKGSIGMLQRKFNIAFNRAAKIMDQLEEAGIVGSDEGIKPRKVLCTDKDLPLIEKACEGIPIDDYYEDTFGEIPIKNDYNDVAFSTYSMVDYSFPPLSLLDMPSIPRGSKENEVKSEALKLTSTLYNFGINASIADYKISSMCNTYDVMLEAGVRVAKVKGLQADLELALCKRVELEVGNKAGVLTIRLLNPKRDKVCISQIIQSSVFRDSNGITIAAGIDDRGDNLCINLTKAPHMIVAGTTGSGKSVFINDIIISILYGYSPRDVKLLLIDPKRVELSKYAGIPHLLVPIVTDSSRALSSLRDLETEMKTRYGVFAKFGVKNIDDYNKKNTNEKLPRIVLIVDEYGELMYNAPKEMEEILCSIARMSRAAGIYMVLSTQRPNSEVITGQIRANVPTRVAFSVINWRESHTIIDQSGAEKLLGKGDMLYLPSDSSKLIHAQAAYVTDSEIDSVVDYIKNRSA